MLEYSYGSYGEPFSLSYKHDIIESLIIMSQSPGQNLVSFFMMSQESNDASGHHIGRPSIYS